MMMQHVFYDRLKSKLQYLSDLYSSDRQSTGGDQYFFKLNGVFFLEGGGR